MVMVRIDVLVHRVKWLSQPNKVRSKTYCGIEAVVRRQGPDDGRPVGTYSEDPITCLECAWRTNPV